MNQVKSKEWPEDATLFQPYEAEQILLPENASCLAVKAYLKMCGLPFQVKSYPNAEFMSPGGRMTKLPFLRVGAFMVAEFEPIVAFVDLKGCGISQHLDDSEKSDMRTYVSLVENIFSMAETYVSFANKQVYDEVTSQRYGCTFPWPLNLMQNYKKRNNAMRLLQVYQWKGMTMAEVSDKIEKCCEALTLKLHESGSEYFYSDRPSELDAIVFGHLFSILTTKLPTMDLADTVKKFQPLVEFCRSIDAKYF